MLAQAQEQKRVEESEHKKKLKKPHTQSHVQQKAKPASAEQLKALQDFFRR